jgi:phosphonate transport system substrate-binding protein
MKKFVLALVALMTVALLGLGAVAAQDATATAEATPDKTGWPETFIIGVYPGDNIEKALAAAQPLADYLTKKLGVYTTVITGTSYNAVIEAMRAGRADAFEVGPLSYVLASEVANAEALAVSNFSVNADPKSLPGYYSVIFTKKGSGIKTIADLKGKSFSFTDPASTSGYLIPALEIMKDQKFDSKDQLDGFFTAVFAGSHPASVLAVASDKTVAGATFDDNLITQAKSGAAKVCGYNEGDTEGNNVFNKPMTQEQIDQIYDACPDGNLVVIHQSGIIPQTPFAINSKLPQSFKDAVKAALLDLKNDPDAVKALGKFYMDPTTVDTNLKTVDDYYAPVRDAAGKLNPDLLKLPQ